MKFRRFYHLFKPRILPFALTLPELRQSNGEEEDDPMLTWDPEEDTRVLLDEGMVGTTAFMAPETCVNQILSVDDETEFTMHTAQMCDASLTFLSNHNIAQVYWAQFFHSFGRLLLWHCAIRNFGPRPAALRGLRYIGHLRRFLYRVDLSPLIVSLILAIFSQGRV